MPVFSDWENPFVVVSFRSGHVLAFVVICTRLLSSLLYNPSGKNGAGARF